VFRNNFMRKGIEMTFSMINRRGFIQGSIAAGAAVSLLPTSRVLGANNRINIGIIGCGGKGNAHIGWFSKIKNLSIVAVSDPDKRHMSGAARRAARGHKVAQYQDFRKLLEDKNVDLVVIATPNHWHAPLTVMACQAGKDVYVEKPASHSIWEGRKMVEAARKYKRIVQVGTQQRSDPALIEMKNGLARKELGELQWAHALWYAYRNPIGKVNGPTPIPKHINYDLWCGPRPVVPLMRKRLHYDWHWMWDYGNGDMGNRVIHNVDDIHHVLQLKTLPTRAMAVGGRFGFDDDAQTPNTLFTWLEGGTIPIVMESRNLPLRKVKKGKRGTTSIYNRFNRKHRFTNIIKCEGGFFAVTRGGGGVYDNNGKLIRRIKGDSGAGHAENFISAVRSRKVSDLNADILGGHLSAAMVHMGNISYRVGKATGVDQVRDRVKGGIEAKETFKQMLSHVKANGLDINKEKLILGPWLTFNDKTERFTGEHAAEANKYVREDYREQYGIKDEV